MEVGSRKRYLRPDTPRLIGDITNGFTNIGPPRDTVRFFEAKGSESMAEQKYLIIKII